MTCRRRGRGMLPGPGARGYRHRADGDRGMVTLEVALAFPLLMVAVVAGSVLLAAGATQARLTDSARATARGLARGDSPDVAVAAGKQVTPAADVFIVRTRPDVEVRVRQEIRGPGPMLGALGLTLTATVVTAAERAE